MKKILKKLRNKAGESLIETLAAILIFTLASVGMFSMVTAAARINETAKQADRENQSQMVYAEQGEGPGVVGNVTMTLTLTGNGGVTSHINVVVAKVNVYSTEDGLFAYYNYMEGLD